MTLHQFYSYHISSSPVTPTSNPHSDTASSPRRRDPAAPMEDGIAGSLDPAQQDHRRAVEGTSEKTENALLIATPNISETTPASGPTTCSTNNAVSDPDFARDHRIVFTDAPTDSTWDGERVYRCSLAPRHVHGEIQVGITTQTLTHVDAREKEL